MASEISLPENKKNRYRSRKAFRQMRDRRRDGIIKKANEYSKLCSADVCLGIRLRDSGRVYTFLADESGFWSSFESQVVVFPFSWWVVWALTTYRQRHFLHQFEGRLRISLLHMAPSTAVENRRRPTAILAPHRQYDSEGYLRLVIW